MKLPRRLLRTLAAAWCAFVGITCVHAVEPPVRIMPLGDSITYGESNDGTQGGYRNRLYSLLSSAGYNVDFIGTQSDSNNPGLPERDHQGMSGWRVDELIDGRSGEPAEGNIETWLSEEEDPDVILLLIGTNDFLQDLLGWRTETVSGVLAEMDDLITKITTMRPHVKIIVSNLIPTALQDDYGNTAEATQVQFNNAIPGLVEQHVALGHQVSWVDMHSAVPMNTTNFYDGVHPTATGYTKIADKWFPAITSVISPKGTSNPPMIERIKDPEDSTHVSVTFSKPVSDSSVNLTNFSISGGLTISNAVLDSATKRTITLTTSPQTPGATYTLTVSGVRDRRTAQNLIAPVSKALFYPNIFSNGSFEDDYSGWPTHTGNQEIKDETVDPYYQAPDGTKMVAFNTGDSTANGVLSRSFPTTPGKTYQLAFDLGTAGTRTSNWTQQLNINVQGSGILINKNAALTRSYSGINNWFPWDYQFTANSTTTTVIFTDTSPQTSSIDLVLDNVRMSADRATSLAVTSTPNCGVNMTISPNDQDGNGNGITGLIRSYDAGTSVTLTAPASTAGKNFLKWQRDGADLAGSNRTVTITLDANTTLNAVYDASGTILPVAVADSYSMNQNTVLTVSATGVLANDSDANAAPLTAVLDAAPSHGNLTLNANGGFNYTPVANYSGADSFTYHVNNGTLNSTSATVSISVKMVNNAPVAIAQSVSLNEDGTLAVTLTGTDVENSSLSFAKTSPAHGTLSGTAPNLIYTPAANFNGADSFTFTVNDGALTSTPATVSITVNPINDAPVAIAQSVSLNEDGTLAVTLTGTDVENSSLSFAKTSPAHGTLSGTAPNLIYTPTANFNGADSFTFTVNDGALTSTPATVSITVNPINDAPVAMNDGSVDSAFLNVDEDSGSSSPMLVLANDRDVEDDSLTITSATSPNGTVSISSTSTKLRFAPTLNFNGQTTISYTISDGHGGTDNAMVYLTVNPVNDPPLANAQSVTLDEDTPTAITLTGSDVDGETPTFVVTVAPSHGELTGSPPNLTYAPAPNYNGPDAFQFTAGDGSATSSAATVSLTVNEVGGTPFIEWLASRGLETGPGEDSDQDSISNAIEYVIGGDPAGGMDAGMLPTATVLITPPPPEENEPGTGQLVFTYRLTHRAKYDSLATIQVEWTTDPAGPWTVADESHGEVIHTEENAVAPEIDLVQVSIPLSPEGRVFARLKVVFSGDP